MAEGVFTITIFNSSIIRIPKQINVYSIFNISVFYLERIQIFYDYPSFSLTQCNCGLPRWLSGERTCLQDRRHQRCGFDSWIGKIPWRRAQQPTPVFLPGESHGERSLAGYSPWSHKKSNMIEVTEHRTAQHIITMRFQANKNILETIFKQLCLDYS